MARPVTVRSGFMSPESSGCASTKPAPKTHREEIFLSSTPRFISAAGNYFAAQCDTRLILISPVLLAPAVTHVNR